jgi:hypothetical protein
LVLRFRIFKMVVLTVLFEEQHRVFVRRFTEHLGLMGRRLAIKLDMPSPRG